MITPHIVDTPSVPSAEDISRAIRQTNTLGHSKRKRKLRKRKRGITKASRKHNRV